MAQGGGFLGGRLRLAQGEGGHRAGADAALLVAAAPRACSGLLLDVGAGAGAVGLSAALLSPSARVGLIEIEPLACRLASRNIADNALEGRARVVEVDLLDPKARRAAGLSNDVADAVLTNPPYLVRGRSRVSPDPRRALAHVGAAPLAEWTRACLALLKSGGIFAMIHRADALAECLRALDGRLGALRLLPVAPRAGEAATRVLLRGVKGSKTPLTLCAPLVLHEEDGAFTPLADAIFRGEAEAPF
ncbi:MAG TPA: methyltransferase [Methylocystis sp.]|nr:methyltransferase [Methylocystis sp.]